VFGGPVFQTDDRAFRSVQIPREFWKIITFTEQGQLKAKAFLLTQNLNQLGLVRAISEARAPNTCESRYRRSRGVR
jgi:DNA/RNA endonuclease G (NUC1)